MCVASRMDCILAGEGMQCLSPSQQRVDGVAAPRRKFLCLRVVRFAILLCVHACRCPRFTQDGASPFIAVSSTGLVYLAAANAILYALVGSVMGYEVGQCPGKSAGVRAGRKGRGMHAWRVRLGLKEKRVG